MKNAPFHDRSKLGTYKLFLFRALTVCGLCIFGGFGAEYGLRWQKARIAGSDVLEPGMVQYDPELGWKLTPGWTGRHRHFDFEASYSINSAGFRADTPFPAGTKTGRLSIVAGDSFTFGLGVNDRETFVHLLNARQDTGTAFANAAVPGYSTDQEALLIEKRILEHRPDEILLVVYIGNDLLDNERRVPLQVRSPKPHFEVIGESLVLRDIPVPLERGNLTSEPRGLARAVLGSDVSHWTLKTRLEQRSELFRIFSESLLPEANYSAEFVERFGPAVRLFALIIDRIADRCARQKVAFTVALVAGRSFFHRPGSVSAQYQDYFRQQILKSCGESSISVIDVAQLMRPRYSRGQTPWFFPNEGHLTVAGHRVVAELLAGELRRVHARGGAKI